MQKIKLYILLFSVACLVLLIGLIVLLNSLPPDRTGNVLLFYFVFIAFAFCVATLLGFYIRKLFGQRELLNQHLAAAMRQGFWFGLLLAGSLFLLSKGLFSWMNAILLVLCLIFFEAYLITKNDRNS